jgi:hypothetical protein
MGAIYQTSNVVNGKITGEKGRIVMTGNSGRETGVRGFIYPGPQGRGIRRESVILRNPYQTTAQNPSTFMSASASSKIRVKR